MASIYSQYRTEGLSAVHMLGIDQARREKEAQIQLAAQAERLRQAARPTAQQLAAVQERSQQHIDRRASLVSAKARAKAEEEARLQILLEQVAKFVAYPA